MSPLMQQISEASGQSRKAMMQCGGNVSDDKLPIMGYFSDNEPKYFNMWNHLWSPACATEYISRLLEEHDILTRENAASASR